MNWKGKLVALLIWSIFFGAIGSAVYTAAHETIENQNFAIRLAADMNKTTRGKMVLLDARIHKEGVFEVWFTNKDMNTEALGLTDKEAKENKELLDTALEWTVINRDVTIFKWSWARKDRQGNLFVYSQTACVARHILENNPRPECNRAERWTPLPAKNNRFSK